MKPIVIVDVSAGPGSLIRDRRIDAVTRGRPVRLG